MKRDGRASRRRTWIGIAAALIPMLALSALIVRAMGGNTTANIVLGQGDFSHNDPNFINASSLDLPDAVAIDESATPNRLYVADYFNSRVLGFKDVATFVNGGPADLVIGQPDFLSVGVNNGGISASSLSGPYGVVVDTSGNLYVADAYNNRVLEYNTPFAHCGSFPCVGEGANLVFGQGGSFTSSTVNNGGVSANSLDGPEGVALDASGDLYVADYSNNRVLEYNTPLTNTTADLVFGQDGSFTSNTANNGGVSANSLYFPSGVALDASGNLYVADYSNNRVLEYNSPLTTNDTTADLVFGQGSNFTSTTYNNGGESASSLSGPVGVALDASGNLYVADYLNSRVLEYNTPLTAGNTTADLVFGQFGDFTSASPNDRGVSANSLDEPYGVAVDASGNLYVVDNGNNRVLEYNTPLTTDTTADRVLGQGDFSHNDPNFINASSLDIPYSVAIDSSVTPNRLYIADNGNSRVLGYKDIATLMNGGSADLVIGQPDFLSVGCDNSGLSASSLCDPYGVAVDASGNLYVADEDNSRVLEYNTPFADCDDSFPCVGGPANLVFGQGGSFTSSGCNDGGISASSLCEPQGVALDPDGDLYVADYANNRVLEYNTPVTTDNTTADRVFGQGGSFTSSIGDNGGVSANSLGSPFEVALDPSGHLYIADTGNNRVLEYNTPLTNSAADSGVRPGRQLHFRHLRQRRAKR